MLSRVIPCRLRDHMGYLVSNQCQSHVRQKLYPLYSYAGPFYRLFDNLDQFIFELVECSFHWFLYFHDHLQEEFIWIPHGYGLRLYLSWLIFRNCCLPEQGHSTVFLLLWNIYGYWFDLQICNYLKSDLNIFSKRSLLIICYCNNFCALRILFQWSCKF